MATRYRHCLPLLSRYVTLFEKESENGYHNARRLLLLAITPVDIGEAIARQSLHIRVALRRIWLWRSGACLRGHTRDITNAVERYY